MVGHHCQKFEGSQLKMEEFGSVAAQQQEWSYRVERD